MFFLWVSCVCYVANWIISGLNVAVYLFRVNFFPSDNGRVLCLFAEKTHEKVKRASSEIRVSPFYLSNCRLCEIEVSWMVV